MHDLRNSCNRTFCTYLYNTFHLIPSLPVARTRFQRSRFSLLSLSLFLFLSSFLFVSFYNGERRCRSTASSDPSSWGRRGLKCHSFSSRARSRAPKERARLSTPFFSPTFFLPIFLQHQPRRAVFRRPSNSCPVTRQARNWETTIVRGECSARLKEKEMRERERERRGRGRKRRWEAGNGKSTGFATIRA